MRHLITICYFLAVTVIAHAGLSEKQVYAKSRSKLRAAHAYQVEIWSLNEKGENPKNAQTILFDAKRGFRVKSGNSITKIGNKSRVWELDSKGEASATPRDDQNTPSFLELYVGKDRPWPSSFGTTAKIVTFDGRRCYVLNPTYGESIHTAVTLYVDVKSSLPAGYTESIQGTWSSTYSFKHLKLNPTYNPKAFLLPKARRTSNQKASNQFVSTKAVEGQVPISLSDRCQGHKKSSKMRACSMHVRTWSKIHATVTSESGTTSLCPPA